MTEANKTLGVAPCSTCGFDACEVKVSKSRKSYLYAHCPPEADGGCNTQRFCRSAKASQALARSITKWRHPEDKAKFLGSDPEPQPEPKPEPKPDPSPAPKPEPETDLPWWDKPIL